MSQAIHPCSLCGHDKRSGPWCIACDRPVPTRGPLHVVPVMFEDPSRVGATHYHASVCTACGHDVASRYHIAAFMTFLLR